LQLLTPLFGNEKELPFIHMAATYKIPGLLLSVLERNVLISGISGVIRFTSSEVHKSWTSRSVVFLSTSRKKA